MQRHIDAAVRFRDRELDLVVTTGWVTARMSRFKQIKALSHYLRRGVRSEPLPAPPEPQRKSIMRTAATWAKQLVGGGGDG